jgi:two-component system, cell cycle sensor histidine kinase and response regulator CckA
MPDSPLILVVDDEEQIAFLASLFLERAGFRTLKATSGHQALAVWTQEIGVLLTDCAMPDLFGDQLAICLLERNPELKVLFMSGNSVSSLETSIPLQPGINFIQKPFASSDLVDFVRQALQRTDHVNPDRSASNSVIIDTVPGKHEKESKHCP